MGGGHTEVGSDCGRLIAEALDDGVWMVDLRANQAQIDERLRATLGFGPSDPVSLDALIERVHPADRDRVREAVEAHLASRERLVVEASFVTPAGDRPFALRGQAEWDESGQPIRLAGVLSDLTERRRIDDAHALITHASRALCSTLEYDRALDSVARLASTRVADYCVVDLVRDDGSIELVVLAHRDAEQNAHLRVIGERHPVDIRAPRATGRVLRQGRTELIERLERDDGIRDDARVALLYDLGVRSTICLPIVVGGGAAIAGAITMCRTAASRSYDAADVPLFEELAWIASSAVDSARLYREIMSLLAQRDAALTLARSERARFYRLLMQAPALIAFLQGARHRIEFANAFFERVVGQSLAGKTVRDAFPQLDGDMFQASLDRVFRTGVPKVRREVQITFDRYGTGSVEPGWFNFLYQPTRDDSGRVDGVLIHGIEVTEQVRAREHVERINEGLERRVEERTAQLVDANRELEAFSYSVSHDLRAPVRHITGFVNLLKSRVDGQLDERSASLLDTVEQSAQQMGKLIDALLAFSRMGRVDLQCERVDLASVVREAIDDLGPDANGRSIEWSIAELPDVLADPTMLRVVISNLVANAIKYTGRAAEPRIEIGVAPQRSVGEVTIFVRDNGVGFDMAYAAKLFAVFQRLHGDAEFAGTGIGLATVKRIVQRHGGSVWAQGEVGNGATFFLSLPTAPAAERTTDTARLPVLAGPTEGELQS